MSDSNDSIVTVQSQRQEQPHKRQSRTDRVEPQQQQQPEGPVVLEPSRQTQRQEQQEQPQPTVQHQHKQRQARRPVVVTFAPLETNVHIPNPLKKPQRRKLWYSHSELNALQAGHSKAITKLLGDNNNKQKRHKKGNAVISLETRQTVCNVFHACSSQNSFAPESDNHPRRRQQQQPALPLVQCFQESLEVVGLERQILGMHGSMARSYRRKALMEAIQEIQKEYCTKAHDGSVTTTTTTTAPNNDKNTSTLLPNNNNTTTTTTRSLQVVEEKLGEASRRISRPSRIFAMRIAMAASAVVT